MVPPRDRERVRGKEREGMIFARESCAVRRTAAQNHPLLPAPLRAFSSLFLALLAVLFFFSRWAAVAARALLFIPVDRVDFSFRASAQPRPRATMAACPKIRRWGGALSRDPRVFFADSPRASAPYLAHPPSPPLRSSPFPCALFSLPFFCPSHPSASTCRRRRRRSDHPPSPSVLYSLHSSASPPGVYFKRSLEPTPAPFRGVTVRYVRSVLYTILEARNVCARLWLGVYTAAV